jgi:hypothetical protein
MNRLPGSDLCEFRTFAFAFPSNGNRSKTRPYQFGMAATRPPPPAPMANGRMVYASDPVPDIECGGKNFCTSASIMRSAGTSDSGVVHDLLTQKAISPDVNLCGQPAWTEGNSANEASAKLKSHLAVIKSKNK